MIEIIGDHIERRGVVVFLQYWKAIFELIFPAVVKRDDGGVRRQRLSFFEIVG
jgi:hypothetical protein